MLCSCVYSGVFQIENRYSGNRTEVEICWQLVNEIRAGNVFFPNVSILCSLFARIRQSRSRIKRCCIRSGVGKLRLANTCRNFHIPYVIQYGTCRTKETKTIEAIVKSSRHAFFSLN